MSKFNSVTPSQFFSEEERFIADYVQPMKPFFSMSREQEQLLDTLPLAARVKVVLTLLDCPLSDLAVASAMALLNGDEECQMMRGTFVDFEIPFYEGAEPSHILEFLRRRDGRFNGATCGEIQVIMSEFYAKGVVDSVVRAYVRGWDKIGMYPYDLYTCFEDSYEHTGYTLDPVLRESILCTPAPGWFMRLVQWASREQRASRMKQRAVKSARCDGFVSEGWAQDVIDIPDRPRPDDCLDLCPDD